MAQRIWTADWHLGSSILLDAKVMGSSVRPFKDVDAMKSAFLKSVADKSTKADTIVHVGDFASYGIDRGYYGLKEKPSDIVAKIPATFVNIRGNHDINNGVFCLGNSLNLGLGKRYPFVSASHYPSYDKRAFGTFTEGTIHLCGHVHKKWKHCLDLTHSVLNINVGVDVWNYQVVTEDELIKYINFLLSKRSDELFRIKISTGKKAEIYGNPRE
jgi:calcineurin-like phosphoesterase family protein